ncbi:MAG: type II toxin-antitoxin system PemK/MazF family toxin [Anaerolineales bacterium]|nr:type II toxin-antitoxin system PemK/MazF family toxin [Anaerolineales bacterium]
MVTKRFEVYLVNLDPTVGSEIKKMRPCLIISPDEMNVHIATVIIAPMTCTGYFTHPSDFLGFYAGFSIMGSSFYPQGGLSLFFKKTHGDHLKDFLANTPITSSKTQVDLIS